jgi:aldehyde:ferredoxin oxidoreductase
MECFQRGIIDERDTDGLRLEWGDAAVTLELIRKIAYREGFGNLLAEGCARAADLLGRDSQYYAMHIKGQDLYEPLRGSLGWCLGTTTSTRGGGHTTGSVAAETNPGIDHPKARAIYGVDNPHKPQEYEGKAKMVAYIEELMRACNSLGICIFSSTYLDVELMGIPQLAELYSAATGWDTDAEDIKHKARRQLNLEKAFNLRHTSFGRKDDLPTPRDMCEPIPKGSLAGWKMDERQFNRMLDDYYDLHGWDRETSFPKRETLLALGLEDVARDLEKIGKLR